MAACLLAICRFVLFPPPLSTLDRIAADQRHFRFWSLLNELGYGSTGRFLRPFWKVLPRLLVYRLMVVPPFAWHAAKASRKAARGPHARQLGLPANELFFKILTALLKYPGLIPDDYFIYGLHLPANARFAEHAADNLHVRFLVDLGTMDRPREKGRFSNVANDKRRFHDLVKEQGFPAAPILAVFGKEVEWVDEPALPHRDLFVKPRSGTLSIGASVVSFDADTRCYAIRKPAEPFPASLNFPGYPAESVSGEDLIGVLTELGKKLPLMLQPKLRCHPALETLTGSSQLTTCRIISARAVGSRADLLGAYLRMPSDAESSDAFASGGIGASLDLETGQILCAKRKFEDDVLRSHPLTQQPFRGVQIPFAREAFAACRAVHDALAAIDEVLVPIVGFDVAIAEDGCWFMEANCPSNLFLQKLGEPYGSDPRYLRCVQSHLMPLAGRSRIAVDPILRKSAAGV